MNNTSQDSRERIGVRNTHNIISIIFLSLVALLALSFSIMLLIKNASLKREEEAVRMELEALNNEGYYTLTEADRLVEEAKKEAEIETTNSIKSKIQSKLEAGEGTTATIRSLFPEQMVVASSGKYYFFPILDSIAHHGFGDEDFVVGDDGFLKYVGNDTNVHVKKGIDVSRFQGKINWKKVADAGIDFAFIRVGLRGTKEGTLLVDDCFSDNIKGATENGIDVGVYFYSQALNEEEAKEELQIVLDNIEPYSIKYPVVIDIESADSDTARTNNMTSDDYENVVRVFCDMVRSAGYKPMVYGNVKSFTLLMDAKDVDDYGIWIAYYGTPLYYPYHFDVWQFSSTGTVDGIEGNVDLDICITEY
ncbi:glycoside hydrolase family 25 protein [Butyrivibrio sp. YAB3001]|uniref:glycoside hydrolase family 25 protein n=1 Tax=Butyrivibrio sp. YAB3001 TaxID=1520812 RepID=UPI0008F6778F|nr:glycoside hydrolase family 25 protein [Butyrivibrio sp. YAB3001]SFB68842.1 Lyzozyme M1 (1,4-beta-N-acetylmuramidase), GH25 family [Butyrivibrio sp. YAB3001]